MTDDAYQLLLERLAAPDGGGAAAPSVAELLEQLGQDDPQLGLLAKVLARRQAQVEAEAEAEAPPDILDAPPDDPSEAPAEPDAGQDLADLTGALYGEVDALRRRNDSLAAGLGACYLCWGEHPGCRVCQGRGGPGARRPDAAAYGYYVTPAVRWMAGRGPRRPPTEHDDSDKSEERSDA
jgi:hypothetical protein